MSNLIFFKNNFYSQYNAILYVLCFDASTKVMSTHKHTLIHTHKVLKGLLDFKF